jgi:3-hydroxybutyryl-CoA dehydrogenase
MILGIAASEGQRTEIAAKPIHSSVTIEWAFETEELIHHTSADCLIDCTFSGTELPKLDKPLLVHAPAATLTELKGEGSVARFCAWNTFVKRDIWEIAVAFNTDATWVEKIMNAVGWKILLVKDKPGLVAPRIVSGIINEAYFTLHAGVSTKEEIDLAMKLGTNYPYGPIEWGQRIGMLHVNNLLQVLSSTDKRYLPAFVV